MLKAIDYLRSGDEFYQFEKFIDRSLICECNGESSKWFYLTLPDTLFCSDVVFKNIKQEYEKEGFSLSICGLILYKKDADNKIPEICYVDNEDCVQKWVPSGVPQKTYSERFGDSISNMLTLKSFEKFKLFVDKRKFERIIAIKFNKST